ncbi:Transcription initiation factor IIA small chain (TFIIA 13.5 kDa subunit) [Clydaea vesicula]|uniref:Transcription initiation factor IIA subunit 2 n=1 Tax=Clydaea vesicula TaxID=447962 RepID=A0AAD5UBP3_9FUNG|nr:Transcription initiation factor IIA small chain (TFIIA 13.5 kDa subunit) [Clydaea vesicula]
MLKVKSTSLCNAKNLMNSETQYQLYRRSSLGSTLTDALDELISSGLMDPQIAMKILTQFDSSISEALRTKIKAKATLKGHLDEYRFCEDVWTFVIDNPTFRFENETVTVEKAKIVACSVKAPEVK